MISPAPSLSNVQLVSNTAPLASGDPTGVTDRKNLLAAIAATNVGGTLLIPNPIRNNQSKYMIDQPIVIPQNMRVIGESLVELWQAGGGGITNTNGPGSHVSSGTPCFVHADAFSGVVIEQQTAATDVFQFPTAARAIHLENLCGTFAAAIADTNTGHVFNATPTTLFSGKPDDGMASATWRNLVAAGHDGNHYGFVRINAIYCTDFHLRSYGGGGFYFECNSALSSYGNHVSIHPYAFVYNAGTAHGYGFKGGATTFPGQLGLMTFIRPQSIAHNVVRSAATQQGWNDLIGVACSGIAAHDADIENFASDTIGSGTQWIGHGIHYNTATSGRYIDSNQVTSYGIGALGALTTGANDSAFGTNALAAATTGANNTAMGQGAAVALTSGGDCTALGVQAAGSLVDGNENTCLGASAGQLGGGTAGNSIVHGAENTYVGSQAGGSSNNDRSHATALGFRAVINGHFATALGRGASAGAAGATAIGCDSAGTGASTTTQDVIAIGTALSQVQLKNNTTGTGSAALGANSPAITNTAPYTWFKLMSSDGSTVYVPAWK